MSWWFWLIVGVGILCFAFGLIVVLSALSRASQSDWVFEFDPPDGYDKPNASSYTDPNRRRGSRLQSDQQSELRAPRMFGR
jgi:hypothetical protein